MKKLLFLTAMALGVASGAFAINPTNSFYVPKKGNFLFRGDAAWTRVQDKTGTDTYTSIDGMYGLANGLALTAGVYEEPAVVNIARASLNYRYEWEENPSRIPEIGVRFVPTLDNGLRVAAEAAYGFGSYGSDTAERDYIRGKLTGGIDVGSFIFGAFIDYAHYYRFAKNTIWDGSYNIHNVNLYGGGLVATYNVNDKTSVDLTYRHAFKDSIELRHNNWNLKLWNKTDAVKLSTTYEFKEGAYVTPYVGYTWVDKKVSRSFGGAFQRNTTTFGVNVAVEF